MNSRERAITALSLEMPDRVPLFDALIDYPIVKEVTGKGLGLTRESIEIDLETMNECHKKLGFDFLVYYPGYGGSEGFRHVDEKTYIDNWGAIRRQVNFPLLEDLYVGGSIKSEEDFENFDFPDPRQTVESIIDVEKIFRKIKEERLLVGGVIGGFLIGMEMRGMANFLIDCHRNPRFATKIMDIVHKFSTQVAGAMADIGIEVLLYDDDYADSKGPLLSPEVWKKLVKPFQKSFIRKFKKRGLWVIEHSDGNVTPLMNDLLESGIDGLHPIEPGAMQMGQVKKEYGDRICLFGNVGLSANSASDIV